MTNDPSATADRDALIRLLEQKPYLAPEFERIAAYCQGKGYGAATCAQEVMVVRHLLKRDPVLSVDIGGNVGDYTAELRKLSGALEIHVFEPAATNIAKLKARFAADAGVVVAPFAVSDAPGTQVLYSNEAGSGLASLTQRQLDHYNIRFDIRESITAVRFEDYWRESLGERQIDIAKIDVEGHELGVLRSFGRALPATRVIQFEFGGTSIDTRTYFRDYWYFFTEHAFDLFRITPFGYASIERYTEAEEVFSVMNIVAVNRR